MVGRKLQWADSFILNEEPTTLPYDPHDRHGWIKSHYYVCMMDVRMYTTINQSIKLQTLLTWAKIMMRAFCLRNVLFPVTWPQGGGGRGEHGPPPLVCVCVRTHTNVPPMLGPVMIHNLCWFILQSLHTKCVLCKASTTGWRPLTIFICKSLDNCGRQ